MRDGLALQAGTSHQFGQNFSRAYDIAFTNRENERELAYTTSWGMSTRMIGGLVMAHGDDSGLVMPPRIAPVQVAIVPIFRDEDSRRAVEEFLKPLTAELKGRVRFKVDWRDERPGNKYAHWEVRGVPLRVEVGPRDIEAGQVMVADRLSREKTPVPVAGLADRLVGLLDEFHARLFQRALDFRAEHTYRPGRRRSCGRSSRRGTASPGRPTATARSARRRSRPSWGSPPATSPSRSRASTATAASGADSRRRPW